MPDPGRHPRGQRSGGILSLPPRAAALIMGFTPIIALWMFFATYRAISYSWVWLVAIPVIGVLIYGPRADPRD